MSDQSWFDDDAEDAEPVVDADAGFCRAMETLDAARILSCWSDSDRITMLFPGADLARGREAVKEAWETVARNTRGLRVLLRPLNVMRLGDMGWTFLAGSLVSTHGDESLTIEVFVTNIYRREEDGWKLIHHHSAPGPHQPSYLEQRLN